MFTTIHLTTIITKNQFDIDEPKPSIVYMDS
jgi:hypothetical protein